MLRFVQIASCLIAAIAISPRAVECGEPLASCNRPGGCTTKTVFLPRIAYKMAQVPVVTLQPQVAEKTITVTRDVPEFRTVVRQVPVLVPEEQTRTETYTECRLVEEVSREVVVMQPHVEARDTVRTTSRPVLAQERRRVSKDDGGWAVKRWTDAHGCMRTCRVWVPRIVEEEITLMVPVLEPVETPVREEVVVFQPETRTVTERICRPVMETKTREVICTVCVEKLVDREFTEVTWQQETEEQVVNYLVPELVTEERELLMAERTLEPRRVVCPRRACER
jgi:hypothetical protein